MPYIKQASRDIYDKEIAELVEKLTDYGANTPPNVGHLNYVISKLVWGIFEKNGPSYTLGNNMIGALECVKQEFYRRQLASYEDLKIVENGDIKNNS
jgi:hypothetical protein